MEELTGPEVARRIMPDLLTQAAEKLSEGLQSADLSIRGQVETGKALRQLAKVLGFR